MIKINYINGNFVYITDKTPDYRGSFYGENDKIMVYSENEIKICYDLLKNIPQPILFDVGACTGSYSLLPTILSNLICYSWEPSRAYNELLKNIKLNGISEKVVISNKAVGNIDGGGIFNELRIDSQIALSMLGGTPASHKLYDEKNIEVIRLDTFCDIHKVVPSLIKIDVEGGELMVLEGAGGLIKNHQPIILCEYSKENSDQYGYSHNDIIKYLTLNNYNVTLMGNDILGIYNTA